jgi:hypothetical protein
MASSKGKAAVAVLAGLGVGAFLLAKPKKASAAAAKPTEGEEAEQAPTPEVKLPSLSKAQLAQGALAAHLLALEKRHGSVKAAKGKQTRRVVDAYQTAAKLKRDGMPGPGTLLSMARVGPTGVLPHVWYWPKGATTTDVKKYRDELEKIASFFEGTGATGRAADLRATALREHGEGGVAGTPGAPRVKMTPAGPVTVRPTTPAPAPQKPQAVEPPVPPPPPASAMPTAKARMLAVGDPQPSWPLLGPATPGKNYTTKGSQVKAWQNTLLRFNPKALPVYGADGSFGKVGKSETEAATKGLQLAVNKLYGRFGVGALKVDGVVGEQTRTGAARLLAAENAAA